MSFWKFGFFKGLIFRDEKADAKEKSKKEEGSKKEGSKKEDKKLVF